MAHAGGRPSKYTTKLGNDICQRIAEGESLRAICRDKDMPNASTVHAWVLDNEEFSKQYESARLMQAHHMFEELLEIADDGTNDWTTRESKDGTEYEVVNPEVVARSRLRVDTRKWFLSKVAPKIYGDKLELAGDKDNPLELKTTIVLAAAKKALEGK